jgi:enamine deaminase RidA (YjgF/YER057c/UK114 family)
LYCKYLLVSLFCFGAWLLILEYCKNKYIMNTKEFRTFDMPWEKGYGYVQSVKSGDTVWISGQLGHDMEGNLAAGTSTGGMTNKKFGRVGDAPIIGAGTYADNNSCAVSCTGWGEYFIRLVVAKAVGDLMEYKKVSLKEAADELIMKKVPQLGGDGGLIAVDKKGNIAMPFNTAGMYRGYIKSDGSSERVKRFRERLGNGECNVTETPNGTGPETETETDIEKPDANASGKKKGGDDGSKRGTRLPANWAPSDDDSQFAQEQGLDADAVAERFRDHWISKPGRDGCKLDWSATWRNWCRNDSGSHHRGFGQPRSNQARPGSLLAAAHAVLSAPGEAKQRGS